jgi:glycosyltransferase involved in cell wall biosynthesis
LLFSRNPYNASRFISHRAKKKLSEILRDNKYDIVQLESIYMCPYISVIKKFSSAKISLRAHNIESEIWARRARNESSSLKKILLLNIFSRMLNFEKKFINKYDILIPITNKDFEQYQMWGNNKPAIIAPFGINAKEYKMESTPSSKPLKLFFLGSLDWIPNIEGLLWFVEKVFKPISNSNIELHIAGRNSNSRLRQTLKKEKNIIFHGEVESSKDYVLDKHIMVVPLFAGSGMRVKIIEGMAMGKPVISTPLGMEGINVTNGEMANICPQADCFIKTIMDFFDNPEKINIIGEKAHEFVKNNFDTFTIANKVNEMYKIITTNNNNNKCN